MNTTQTTWGSWSLRWDGTVLCHDGGYSVALDDIRDLEWWIEHLRGKGWATTEVLNDFWYAVMSVKGSEL
jgi:hypothetical protein